MVYDFSSHSFPQLYQKETMGRNDRCWCGSGMKWKSCHRDREKQEPINIYQKLEELDVHFAEGKCLHPHASDKSCSSVIRAHTIQRGGGLKTIAEDYHVLSVKHIWGRLMMGAK